MRRSPLNVTRAAQKLAAFRVTGAGVNRLSLGVQSFDDGALTALGRIHSAEQSRRAVTAARELFERFNIDLMHGLPGQDQQQALDDVSEAINQGADHISWYQLTIEPNTAFYSSPPTLPVEDTLATIQTEGEALLHTAGFHQYEVSAWARPGQASRHNMNYWTFGDYIGIGAGAHGKITEPNGTIDAHPAQSSTQRLHGLYCRADTAH